MDLPLPKNALEFMSWEWSQIEPYYQALTDQGINQENVSGWLANWSRLSELISETYSRLYVATTIDTTDQDSETRYNRFLDEIFPRAQAAEQVLKEKLVKSNLEVKGFEVPLRNLRSESEIFRQENLVLLAKELKQVAEYDKVLGAQTIQWDGKEITLKQADPYLEETDRSRREQIWRACMQRSLADREALNTLWREMLAMRAEIAENAGCGDYREYRWRQMLRFEYSPQDCERFHAAIEAVVVPAAVELYEKRRRRMGLDKLRPWDLTVNASGLPPLRPFEQVERLELGVSEIFGRIDPELGEYFEIMRREKLLDLENRKGKAPGGYCTDFIVAQRPFIFMNAVGIHEDVQTLLHEGGHAFHTFECAHLPFARLKEYPLEFAEVASMSMELLSAPYLAMPGGFYLPADAARARITHLTESIWFWPYMAVVDAFQHWVYTHGTDAADPAACDLKWKELWQRFMVGVDWSGLDDEMVTGWQRKPHIFEAPFYYVEYGLAQLGAFQVWQNSLTDRPGAIRAYRSALALGGSAPLPELYQAAGARLAFDADALGEAVRLGMLTITELDAVHG